MDLGERQWIIINLTRWRRQVQLLYQMWFRCLSKSAHSLMSGMQPWTWPVLPPHCLLIKTTQSSCQGHQHTEHHCPASGIYYLSSSVSLFSSRHCDHLPFHKYHRGSLHGLRSTDGTQGARSSYYSRLIGKMFAVRE